MYVWFCFLLRHMKVATDAYETYYGIICAILLRNSSCKTNVYVQ
jgi:hypothetical protein